MEFAPDTMTALVDMLKTGEEDSDSDEDKPSTEFAKLGPGSIGAPTKSSQPENNKDTPKNKKDIQNEKDIWTEEEVGDGAEYDDLHDPRPQPEYDIIFKQSVTSEDIFLQMGNKTPGSASCEAMVVKISLPNTKIADVELDVKKQFLDCRTPKIKLGLHLPHPVDAERAKAQWITEKEQLVVTMKMTRDFDFMNF